LDGIIQGLYQAPKTTHVWEHKCTNEKKFKKMDNLKAEKGEKEALKLWDEVYYAQAVIYMYYMGFTRHYMTISTPGGREQTSCRTNANNKDAKLLIDKAKRIIESTEPLDKISDKPEFYLCGWCSFKQVCHHGAMPEINCRTCAHSTPEMDGDGRWSCALYKADIPVEFQRKGCERHIYNPNLLAYKAVDANQDENWIEYQKPNGAKFRNGDGYFSSEEIRTGDHSGLGDPGIEALKKPLGAAWLVPADTPDLIQATQQSTETSTINGIPSKYLATNASTLPPIK